MKGKKTEERKTENITIGIERYEELIRKEFAFDAYKRKVEERKGRGWTLLDIEELLFTDDDDVFNGLGELMRPLP